MVDAGALVEVLKAELALLEKLVDVERKVYAALLKADSRELDRLNGSKEEMVEKLAALEERRALLVPAGETLRNLIDSGSLKGREAEVSALRRQLKERGEGLQHLQQQNRKLIRSSLRFTRQVLELLLPAGEKTYTGDGGVEHGFSPAGKINSRA